MFLGYLSTTRGAASGGGFFLFCDVASHFLSSFSFLFFVYLSWLNLFPKRAAVIYQRQRIMQHKETPHRHGGRCRGGVDSFDVTLRLLAYIYRNRLSSSPYLTGDIYDKVQEALAKKGMDTECLGGGRIVHDPDKKTILVFGYSQVKYLKKISLY